MNTEGAKRRMGEERAKALRPDPVRKSTGSAGHQNQYGHTRVVGEDPLTRHAVVNPSRVQPKTETPKLRSRQANTSRQHP